MAHPVVILTASASLPVHVADILSLLFRKSRC